MEGFGAEGDGGAEGFGGGKTGDFAVVGRGGVAAVFWDWEDFCAASGEFGAEGRGGGGGLGGDSAEDEDGFSGDVLEEGEGEEGLGVADGRGGERVAEGEGVGGGLSDGEGWDGGGGGGVSGCGFGGDEDGEVGEVGEVGGGGGLGGEVADDDGGSEEGLVSALRQFRREVLRAVERTSEPNGGFGEGGHGGIIL